METDDLQDCGQLGVVCVCTHSCVCACMHTWVCVCIWGGAILLVAELPKGYGGKNPQRNKNKTPVPSYQGRHRNMGAMMAALSSYWENCQLTSEQPVSRQGPAGSLCPHANTSARTLSVTLRGKRLWIFPLHLSYLKLGVALSTKIYVFSRPQVLKRRVF